MRCTCVHMLLRSSCQKGTVPHKALITAIYEALHMPSAETNWKSVRETEQKCLPSDFILPLAHLQTAHDAQLRQQSLVNNHYIPSGQKVASEDKGKGEETQVDTMENTSKSQLLQFVFLHPIQNPYFNRLVSPRLTQSSPFTWRRQHHTTVVWLGIKWTNKRLVLDP